MINVSLFTGAGGLDLGLERAGIELDLAVENDANCRETLNANRRYFARPFYIMDDVNDLVPEDLPAYPDVVSGGPPCQSFSHAGKRGFLTDPRGALMLQFIMLIQKMRPRFFVMENVPGLMTAQKGALVRESILPAMRPYQVGYAIVNAVDYGTAQLRKRVVFIGSLQWELTQDVLTMLAPAQSRGRVLRDAIWGLRGNAGPGSGYSPEVREVYERVPEGRNWRHLRDTYGEAYCDRVMGGAKEGGRTGFWRRLAWDKPAPTLVAWPVQKATGLCHPEETRPLSIAEYAALQDFPKGYQLVGSMQSQYRQLGNAVPVNLGEAIGMGLLEAAR